VGKVKSIQLAPPQDRVNGKDTTEAVLEIQPEYAPISTDAKAILRQKTLLGETYVELTSGTEPDGNPAPVSLGSAAAATDTNAKNVKSIPEGGTLGIGQTEEATQIDEIFNALDKQTRAAFQSWIQNAAVAINGRGLDLNDALGNLGPFASDAANVLGVLHRQDAALHGLVRDTGTVFDALNRYNDQLAGAITGSNTTFDALAREHSALARTFEIFPTFEHESRLTLAALDRFGTNTRPLIRKLLPVANDVSPTLRSVRELSPPLRQLFVKLNPLIKAARTGLPATARFLGGLRPVLASLDPFLANLNPVIDFLNAYKTDITNWMSNPETGFAELIPVAGERQPHFSLRVLSYLSAESLSIWPKRLPTNRGNAYFAPNGIIGQGAAHKGIFPNFDCKNLDFTPVAGGDPDEDPLLPGQSKPDVNGGNPPGPGFAPCFIQKKSQFGNGQFPRVYAEP
jgi:ABC-type transporter Mla subunit MlaD